MPFILTYVQINGETNMWGVSVAIITMIAIALFSHYAKGIVKILPFLLGTLVGYAYAVVLTITNIFPVVDFSVFENMRLFALPDLAISHVNWYKFIELPQLIPLIILFIAYTISAMMEALSDHATLGGIIGIDLYQKPGLNRIFAGEGLANAISGLLGGLCELCIQRLCLALAQEGLRAAGDGARQSGALTALHENDNGDCQSGQKLKYRENKLDSVHLYPILSMFTN